MTPYRLEIVRETSVDKDRMTKEEEVKVIPLMDLTDEQVKSELLLFLLLEPDMQWGEEWKIWADFALVTQWRPVPDKPRVFTRYRAMIFAASPVWLKGDWAVGRDRDAD